MACIDKLLNNLHPEHKAANTNKLKLKLTLLVHRPAASPVQPAHGSVVFTVLPPMPRLEVTLTDLPPSMLSGQLARCMLRLRNTAAMTLQGLSVAVDSAQLYLGDAPEDAVLSTNSADRQPGNGALDCPVAATASGSQAATQPPADGNAAHRPTENGVDDRAGSGGAASTSRSLPDSHSGIQPGAAQVLRPVSAVRRRTATVYTFPPTTRLSMRSALLLPVWVRAGGEGPLRIITVWHYEPLVPLDALKFRCLRSSFSSAAVPSMQVGTPAHACYFFSCTHEIMHIVSLCAYDVQIGLILFYCHI